MEHVAWIPFLIACAAIELTPGPNMAYLVLLTALSGRRAGLQAVAGIALGLACVGISAALGVAVLINESRVAYQLLVLAGFAYLLWLAWRSWYGEETGPEQAALTPATPRYFVRGMVTNLLNPKAYLFYIVLLPGFMGSEHTRHDAVLLTLISLAVATTVHLGLVLGTSMVQTRKLTAGQQRQLQRWMAFALFAIAMWFAASNLSVIL